jgi:hypothetical protein
MAISRRLNDTAAMLFRMTLKKGSVLDEECL